MRWSNAFMFNAMAHYILNKKLKIMEAKSLNGVITFAPSSREELMQYAFDNHKLWLRLMRKRFYMLMITVGH